VRGSVGGRGSAGRGGGGGTGGTGVAQYGEPMHCALHGPPARSWLSFLVGGGALVGGWFLHVPQRCNNSCSPLRALNSLHTKTNPQAPRLQTSKRQNNNRPSSPPPAASSSAATTPPASARPARQPPQPPASAPSSPSALMQGGTGWRAETKIPREAEGRRQIS